MLPLIFFFKAIETTYPIFISAPGKIVCLVWGRVPLPLSGHWPGRERRVRDDRNHQITRNISFLPCDPLSVQ